MLKKPYNALIIGMRDDGQKPNIGGGLCRALRSPHWNPGKDLTWRIGGIATSTDAEVHNEFGVARNKFNSNDRREFRDLLEAVRPNVGFICIPTRDDGTTAWHYAEDLLDFGAVASTAEKGIVSGQYDKAKSRIKDIDLSASIGGSNRFLYAPKLQHLRGRRVTIHAIFNATLHCTLPIARKVSPEEAVDVALKRGIAEPPPNGEQLDFRGLINGEIPDLDKKTRGFYNHLLADNDPLLLKPLGDTQISDADVERLIDPNDNRVMIVKYTNQKAHMSVDDDLIAPLRASVGEWNISVGFKSIAGGRPLAEWLASVTDIDNSVLLSLDGRRYVISTGPGARQATVDALNEEGP